MSGFTCPYCNQTGVLNSSTAKIRNPSFDSDSKSYNPITGEDTSYPSEIAVIFYKCPNCGEYVLRAQGTGDKVKTDMFYLKPSSPAKVFPGYIPIQIRQDYEEACAIEHLSPKASATLSRRCLQGMIHDFWNIIEKNLNAEITKLKDQVPASQWRVIDAVRKLGNIGAHMEKDVNTIIDIDPSEAHKLIQLIEKLIEQWYINRHDEEELYKDIMEIDEDKQAQRKSN